MRWQRTVSAHCSTNQHPLPHGTLDGGCWCWIVTGKKIKATLLPFPFLCNCTGFASFVPDLNGIVVKHWRFLQRSEFPLCQRGLITNSNASWGHPQSPSQISSLDLSMWLVFIAVKAFSSGTYQLARKQLLVQVERHDVNQGWIQTFLYWSNSVTNYYQSCHPKQKLPNVCEKAFTSLMVLSW